MNDKTREQVLADYLGIDVEDVEDGYTDNYYNADGCEYIVLTDNEADDFATDYIRESLWAFNADFLSAFTALPVAMFEAVQGECESSNDAILQCIEQAAGLKEFVEEAISADGRGHFMSSYDGEEIEQGDYFIYRIN